jgi:aspartate-semialdehyde dehydrogenase
MKLVRETQKILDDKTIAVTATAVRVPIVGGHSRSETYSFQMTLKYQTFKVYYIIQMVLSYKTTMIYLSNANVCKERDDVFVGRIRRDESQANTLNMWIVDNLRKGRYKHNSNC